MKALSLRQPTDIRPLPFRPCRGALGFFDPPPGATP